MGYVAVGLHENLSEGEFLVAYPTSPFHVDLGVGKHGKRERQGLKQHHTHLDYQKSGIFEFIFSFTAKPSRSKSCFLLLLHAIFGETDGDTLGAIIIIITQQFT